MPSLLPTVKGGTEIRAAPLTLFLKSSLFLQKALQDLHRCDNHDIAVGGSTQPPGCRSPL